MNRWYQESGNRQVSGSRQTSGGFARYLIPACFLIPVTCALLFLSACAPKSVDDYHTAENDEETVRLLNQREYGKVIWLIESRDGKSPANKHTAFLLAQAYLGKAGMEPLTVAATVTAAQDFSGADAQAIFPSCPSKALTAVKDAEPLCLLKRVFFHVPDPDVYEMTRARDLFRYAYPDASAAPEWVNILVGSVETASVIKRLGSMFLVAKRTVKDGTQPTDQDLRWFAQQLSHLLDDAAHALDRADHTGNKISQLLTGTSGAVWFQKAEAGIKWADQMGLANLFDFLRSTFVYPDAEAQYGPMLDKIRGYLDDQDKRISAQGA